MTNVATTCCPEACCWASAASRWPRRPRPLVMLAMLSSHTAVGWFATRVMAAPSDPPTPAAAEVTSPDQSGLTYPTAPSYALSTCGQDVHGLGLPLGETDGLGDRDGLTLGLGDRDGDTDGVGDADGDPDGVGAGEGAALIVHPW